MKAATAVEPSVQPFAQVGAQAAPKCPQLPKLKARVRLSSPTLLEAPGQLPGACVLPGVLRQLPARQAHEDRAREGHERWAGAIRATLPSSEYVAGLRLPDSRCGFPRRKPSACCSFSGAEGDCVRRRGARSARLPSRHPQGGGISRDSGHGRTGRRSRLATGWIYARWSERGHDQELDSRDRLIRGPCSRCVESRAARKPDVPVIGARLTAARVADLNLGGRAGRPLRSPREQRLASAPSTPLSDGRMSSRSRSYPQPQGHVLVFEIEALAAAPTPTVRTMSAAGAVRRRCAGTAHGGSRARRRFRRRRRHRPCGSGR